MIVYRVFFCRYIFFMTLYEFHLVFPDGDTQEIQHTLRINQLVDVNGIPLQLPLVTNRMLAYSVTKKRTVEEKGLTVTWYHLEQVSANELLAYT